MGEEGFLDYVQSPIFYQQWILYGSGFFDDAATEYSSFDRDRKEENCRILAIKNIANCYFNKLKRNNIWIISIFVKPSDALSYLPFDFQFLHTAIFTDIFDVAVIHPE